MNVFLEGRPTGPDVDAIIKQFPAIATGDIVPFAEIAAIIHEETTSTRMRTVIEAYKRRMYRDRNVEFQRLKTGLQVKDNSQRVEGHSRKLGYAIRSARRAANGAQRTPVEGLTLGEQKTRDHVIITGAAFRVFANRISNQVDWKVDEIKKITDAVSIAVAK